MSKFYQADLSDREFHQNHKHAYYLYNKGEICSWSMGWCESITAGYGRLDEYGYWEFPLEVEDGVVVDFV